MSALPLVQLRQEQFADRQTPLRKPSEAVTDFGLQFQKVVTDLCDTFLAHKIAVGLAAPQIAIPLSVAVVNVRRSQGAENILLVNPEIVSLSGKKDIKREACMSLPFFQGEVERRTKVKLSFQDRDGGKQMLEASGFLARVILHEIDHLNGILYVDQMRPTAQLESADFFEGD